MKKLPKIGQRVVVKANGFLTDSEGQEATVLETQREDSALVSFDTKFNSALHNNSQSALSDMCYWFPIDYLKKVK